jgi:hypothetical protein
MVIVRNARFLPTCQADFGPTFNGPQEAIMAKGRNQDRSQKKTGNGEQDRDRNEGGAAEGRQQRPQVSPADVARKHQRRFGHN